MAVTSPGVIRSQVTFQGRSGTPEDRYVNTWHFIRKDDTLGFPDGGVFSDMGSFADEAARRLVAFYVETAAGAASPLQTWLSGYILPNFTVTTYDLGEPSITAAPRTAYRRPGLLTLSNSGSLPLETALCSSFYAGRNLPRRRGRIYFGPLHATALTGSSPATPKPAPALVTALAAATKVLASPGAGDNLTPAVYSPSDNVGRKITAGWVDDDFDHILNRGPDATMRSSWAA